MNAYPTGFETPTRAAIILGTERRVVIEFCLEHNVPIVYGRIDMAVLGPLWTEHNATTNWHP
jgi:hypothetical protein